MLQVDAYIKEYVLESIATSYKGVYSFDVTSLIINFYMDAVRRHMTATSTDVY